MNERTIYKMVESRRTARSNIEVCLINHQKSTINKIRSRNGHRHIHTATDVANELSTAIVRCSAGIALLELLIFD